MFNLTRAGYYADFAAVPAAIALVIGWRLGWQICAAAAVGLLCWTLVEYLVHRFVFHHAAWLGREHDRHHRDPSAYIGAGSWATWPLLGATYAIAIAVLGADLGQGWSIGFLAGYLTYIVVHDRFHHSGLKPGQMLYAAHHRHALHHRGVEKNFGVITPMWDYVFRTYRR